MSTEDRKKGWEARAVAVRRAEERKAALLKERGWVCVPPDHPSVDFIRGFIQAGEARA